MPTERAAFRALLRACRTADRNPERLVCLVGRPPRRYDSNWGRTMRMNAGGSPFIEDAIREACGGSTEFAHPERGAARRAIRRHFHRALIMNLLYCGEAAQLLKRFDAASAIALQIGSARRDDRAVSGKQQILQTTGSGVVSEPDASLRPPSSPNEDGVGFGAEWTSVDDGLPPTLTRFAADSDEKFTAGDLLIAHPLACLFESVFDQAVLLLDSVDETVGTVTGIVLNKPTGTTLGQMLERWQSAEDRQWVEQIGLGDLASAQLFRGGPVIVSSSLQESLRWLHCCGEGIEGAREVASGLWLGGDLTEVAARCNGDLTAVRFFLGFAGWSQLQLATEFECGVWVRARAQSQGDQRHGVAATPPTASAYSLCLGPLQRDAAWRVAMHGVGMHVLADFPRAPGVDRRLRGYLERIQREISTVEPDSEPQEKVVERSSCKEPSDTRTNSSESIVPGRDRGRGSSRRRRK